MVARDLQGLLAFKESLDLQVPKEEMEFLVHQAPKENKGKREILVFKGFLEYRGKTAHMASEVHLAPKEKRESQGIKVLLVLEE